MRIIVILRYTLAYFHTHIVTIFCFILMSIYYIHCIVSKYYVEIDLYVESIINDKFERGIFSSDKNISSNSIAQIGSINLNIKQKNYNNAIEMIERFKSNIDSKTRLYRMLTIRQALLYIYISGTEEEYKRNLELKFPSFTENTVQNLQNIYKIYRLKYKD